MEIRLTHRFPCDPRAYWEATRQRAYEEMVREEADVDYELLEERDEGPRNYSRARVSPRKELPALVQKALGQARLAYVQEIDASSDTLSTRWRVITDFLPDKIRCGGTSRIVEAPGGCERLIEGAIEVAIPLIGGAIEKQIVGEISRSYDRTAEVLRRYLAQRESRA